MTGGSRDAASAYERAFALYLERRFDEAAGILAPQAGVDPPSAVLLARSRAMAADPPPADWDGIYVAKSK